MKVYKLLPDGLRQVTGFLFPGDCLGLTTEIVSRAFTQLKQEGVIQLLPNH